MGRETDVPPSPMGGGVGGEGDPHRSGLVADLVRDTTARLEAALRLHRREARLEAQILAAHALGVNRAWLIAHDREELTKARAAEVEALVSRRARGEPVAYILGEREFYGRRFKVTPHVLIPRPETELLVEAVLARLPKERPASILDLGTGSGCIAITLALERPAWQVTAIDISPRALEVARANAAALGARLELATSDLFSGLAKINFDCIVSNPPYVADDDDHLGQGDVCHEPRTALASGADGMDAIAAIIAQAPARLNGSGWLYLEHGWDQGDKCRVLMAKFGFMNTQTLSDLAGHPRVTLGQLNGQ